MLLTPSHDRMTFQNAFDFPNFFKALSNVGESSITLLFLYVSDHNDIKRLRSMCLSLEVVFASCGCL